MNFSYSCKQVLYLWSFFSDPWSFFHTFEFVLYPKIGFSYPCKTISYLRNFFHTFEFFYGLLYYEDRRSPYRKQKAVIQGPLVRSSGCRDLGVNADDSSNPAIHCRNYGRILQQMGDMQQHWCFEVAVCGYAGESAMNPPWIRHESAMNPPWIRPFRNQPLTLLSVACRSEQARAFRRWQLNVWTFNWLKTFSFYKALRLYKNTRMKTSMVKAWRQDLSKKNSLQ